MSVVDTSIVLATPPAAVWELIMDPRRLAEWVTIHRDVTSIDDGLPRPGFSMVQTLHLRGTNFKVSWRLAECDALRRAVWEGRGPMHSRAWIEYELAELADGGTRFHYRNEFHPPLGPLGAVAARALIGGIPRREAERSLAKLAAIVDR